MIVIPRASVRKQTAFVAPAHSLPTEVVVPEGRPEGPSSGMTRLSCHRFRSNVVRPRLSVIAYNLGSLWRLVVDQPAAAVGEDGRSIGQARPVVLRQKRVACEKHLGRKALFLFA